MPGLGLFSEGNFTEIRKLKAAEYLKYKKAANHLFKFSADQQLYMIVRLNFEDFNNILKHYYEEYVKHPAIGFPQAERMVLDINRHILNFLTAFRTFLDHSRTNIIRQYGRNSKKLKTYKHACSQVYDNNFSYRFISKLRNYAQHCGMPLGLLKLQSKLIDLDSSNVQHFLTVKFDRDRLLRNFSWGEKLEREIRRLDLTFDINPIIHEAMKCLEEIQLKLIAKDISDLIKSTEYIKQFIAETEKLTGVPCIFTMEDIKRTQKGKIAKFDLNIEWIPLHLVNVIMNFKEITETSHPRSQIVLH